MTTLTLVLQSLARDYRRFMNDDARSRGAKIADEDVKLYVTKVESGSTLAELASATPVVGAFFSIMDYQSFLFNLSRISGPSRIIAVGCCSAGT